MVAKTAQSLRLDLDEILSRLKKKGLNTLAEAKIKFSHNYNRRVINVFEYLLKMFAIADLNDAEQWILMQFSVLPSVHIPYEKNEDINILEFLNLKSSASRDPFTRSINKIVDKGWLHWDKTRDAFKMHQMIQEMIRFQLHPNVEDCKELISQLSQKLYYKNIHNPVHILRFSEYGEQLAQHITGNSSSLFSLTTNLGELHRMLIGFESALDYHMRSLTILEAIENKDLESLGNTHSAIGLCQLGLANFESAIYHQLKEIAIFEQLNKPIDIAISCDNIGLTYQEMGDFKSAEKYHLKANKIFEQHLEESDFSLAQSYHNISLLYANMESFEKALEYNEKAISLRELYLDPLHPNLAQTYHNASFVYYHLGLLQKAQDAIDKAFFIRKTILKENHPYFLNTKKRRSQIIAVRKEKNQ